MRQSVRSVCTLFLLGLLHRHINQCPERVNRCTIRRIIDIYNVEIHATSGEVDMLRRFYAPAWSLAPHRDSPYPRVLAIRARTSLQEHMTSSTLSVNLQIPDVWISPGKVVFAEGWTVWRLILPLPCFV